MLLHLSHLVCSARKSLGSLRQISLLLSGFFSGRRDGNALIGTLLFISIFFSPQLTAESLKLSVGAEFTSGDFGGSDTIDTWYIPVTTKLLTDNYVFRLTIPYISFSAPAGTRVSVGGNSHMTRTGTGASSTVQGIGDIIAAVTTRDVMHSELSSGMSLDFTAKIKFATADENQGLGTGENDYTVQAELMKTYQKFTPYGIAGYTFLGESEGTYLSNVWSGVVGGMYHFTSEWATSLEYYYREASSINSAEQQELSAILNRRVNYRYSVQIYAVHGISDGSPDWGLGAVLSVSP